MVDFKINKLIEKNKEHGSSWKGKTAIYNYVYVKREIDRERERDKI